MLIEVSMCECTFLGRIETDRQRTAEPDGDEGEVGVDIAHCGNDGYYYW